MKFNLKRDGKTPSERKRNSHKIRNDARLNFLPSVRYSNFIKPIFQTLKRKNTHRSLFVDGRTEHKSLVFSWKAQLILAQETFLRKKRRHITGDAVFFPVFLF